MTYNNVSTLQCCSAPHTATRGQSELPHDDDLVLRHVLEVGCLLNTTSADGAWRSLIRVRAFC